MLIWNLTQIVTIVLDGKSIVNDIAYFVLSLLLKGQHGWGSALYGVTNRTRNTVAVSWLLEHFVLMDICCFLAICTCSISSSRRATVLRLTGFIKLLLVC